MDRANPSIKCDVTTCRHHCEGGHCCLDTVKITNDEVGYTCCNDYTHE